MKSRALPDLEPNLNLSLELSLDEPPAGGSPSCSHAGRRYPALTQKIKECMSGACEIEKVEFTSSNGDAGFAIVRGRRLPIRGIPAENPNSDQLC